jgi:anti-sigma factor RsiW
MLKCYIVKDLLPGYVDGLLSEETTAEVKQHLKECDDCGPVL